MKLKSLKPNTTTLALAAAFIVGYSTTQAADLASSVQVAGEPVAG